MNQDHGVAAAANATLAAQFKAFVASKPSDERYNFYRIGGGKEGCPVTQFVTHLGLNSLTDGHDAWMEVHVPLQRQLIRDPHTFGALNKRLTAIKAEAA